MVALQPVKGEIGVAHPVGSQPRHPVVNFRVSAHPQSVQLEQLPLNGADFVEEIQGFQQRRMVHGISEAEIEPDVRLVPAEIVIESAGVCPALLKIRPDGLMLPGQQAIPAVAAAGDAKALNKNLLDRDATIVAKLEGAMMPNKAVSITVDGAKDGYKVYMVKADGSVVDLGATFNANKVLTATATLTGPVIVTDKAITAAGTTGTGTTTNPGTGANDVVGVAAALAVVALVSGAAISLKK